MSIFVMKNHLKDVYNSIISTPNKFSFIISRVYGKSIRINYDDTVAWFYNGVLHRGDGPALIIKDCEKWYYHGALFLVKDKIKEIYYKNDKIHRDNEPAILRKCGCKDYYKNGLLHRNGNKPAIIYCEKHGGSLIWYQNGINYRENGPSEITKQGKEGEVGYRYLERWTNKCGDGHREDGPAATETKIIYCNNEKIIKKEVYWMRYDLLHRNFGPAYIAYYNGLKYQEEYIINGLLHNTVGPALITYKNPFNSDCKVRFYIKGNRLPLNEFTKRLENIMKKYDSQINK